MTRTAQTHLLVRLSHFRSSLYWWYQDFLRTWVLTLVNKRGGTTNPSNSNAEFTFRHQFLKHAVECFVIWCRCLADCLSVRVLCRIQHISSSASSQEDKQVLWMCLYLIFTPTGCDVQLRVNLLLCVCVCVTPACWAWLSQVWYFYINRWCPACLGSLQQQQRGAACYTRWLTASWCKNL